MTIPSPSRLNNDLLRKISAAIRLQSRIWSSAVFFAAKLRARSGMRLSMKEEMQTSGRLSQFQPPSFHCHLTNLEINLSVRSSANPRESVEKTRFPSCDAQRRV